MKGSRFGTQRVEDENFKLLTAQSDGREAASDSCTPTSGLSLEKTAAVLNGRELCHAPGIRPEPKPRRAIYFPVTILNRPRLTRETKIVFCCDLILDAERTMSAIIELEYFLPPEHRVPVAFFSSSYVPG